MIKKLVLRYIRERMGRDSFRGELHNACFEGLEKAYHEDNMPTLISFQMLEIMRFHNKNNQYYKNKYEDLALLGRSAADEFLVENGVKKEDIDDSCPRCRILDKDW